jgi:LPPG:FO 2-phospho-L-lactate transferase
MGNVVYLSGGVGGARLAHGIAKAVDAEHLAIVVNVGDDFTHWGLSISPDLDTVMYTLADLADVERGWGLQDETFHALSMMQRYDAETWFQLGDRDLATHVLRSRWLREGLTLTKVTARLCHALGIAPRVLPASDTPCATMIDTAGGTLTFQDWLVRDRARADVKRVWSRGEPRPSPALLEALDRADTVIIGPSNPYVSIDPILRVPGVRERVAARRTVAVSPIVHGKAVKGPLARMLQTLAGAEPSAAAVAQHYGTLLSGIFVESGDEAAIHDVAVGAGGTVMQTRAQSLSLAHEVLAFADTLPSHRAR